jgi:putative endonuclease
MSLVKKKARFVYIVRCNDDSFYTGITNNLDKRIYDHNNSKVWAKYTKGRRPVVLVWSKRVVDRNTASKLELKIKAMWREKKYELIG